MNFYHLLIIFIITVVVLSAGCTGTTDSGKKPGGTPDPVSNATMRMSVSSVLNGSTLPDLYSCSGPGQVPAIFWKTPPYGTQSMVLIMDDPDAPDGVFTHWIVYNLTPGSEGIPPNQLPVSEKAGSGLQGINSMKTRGYAPPCPPGSEVHRYIFTLYALDSMITPEIPDRSHIDTAIQGHVIEKAQIITLFSRNS